MNFEQAYEKFIKHHEALRHGERLRRLKKGHGHAEKIFLKFIWWPLFRSFEGLHPEYEVTDYQKGSRFLDFAYVHPLFKIAIEIDGFGPHQRDVSRYQFADERRRQTFLVGLGWHVCRFAYDDIEENPEICRQLLQLVMGRFLGINTGNGERRFVEIRDKDILSFALRNVEPLTSKNVAAQFRISTRTARRALQRLTASGCLVPSKPNQQRVHAYNLKENLPQEVLF